MRNAEGPGSADRLDRLRHQYADRRRRIASANKSRGIAMTAKALHALATRVCATGLGLLLTAALVLLDPSQLVLAAEQAAVCKDKKGKAVGVYALGVLKAFGRNTKAPNTAKLAGDLSKAQVRISKGFTRAEFSGYYGSLGCETTGDVGAMEAKTNAFVADVLDEIPPP
jgi:hypothetical protein